MPRIFLAGVEAALRSCSPDTPDGARFGAVIVVHRFGSALNANLHFHCRVIDGVFSAERKGVRFHPAFLTDRALAKVQQQTRRRVLNRFQRRELLSQEAVEMMRGREHDGGFAVNAEARVPSRDRAGLGRAQRALGLPPAQVQTERANGALPDAAGGLGPSRRADPAAAQAPPSLPRRMAPNAPRRPAVTAYAGLPLKLPPPSAPPPSPTTPPEPQRPSRAA